MSCNSPLLIKIKGQYQRVPCRWCMGCRIQRRNEWATRIRLESFDYMRKGFGSSFCTITYNDESYSGGAYISDIQKMNKRLRYYLKRDSSLGIPFDFKYYCVSEYGTAGDRGHFHCIYMGLSSDFLSEYLRKSWKYGFIQVAPLSHSRIRYTLKYMDKQVLSDKDREEYIATYHREPPTAVFSKGIASRYFLENIDSIRENGGLLTDNGIVGLNSYYTKKFGVDTSIRQLAVSNAIKSTAKHYGMSESDYTLYQNYCKELVLNNRARIGGFACPDHIVENAKRNYSRVSTSVLDKIQVDRLADEVLSTE